MMTGAAKSPRISCIVSLYNKAASVGAAIASVRAQSVRDWEMIVVDDGSTDAGAAIVEGHAREDARIRVVRQANAGVSAARNHGIEIASGRYLHFFDADDEMLPEAYERLLAAIGPGTHGAAGAYDVCASDGRVLFTQFRRSAREVIDLDAIVIDGTIWTCAHLIERSVIEEVRFRREFEPYEDTDMWTRLAEAGARWRYVPERVGRYMIHAGSASKAALKYLRLAERSTTEVFARQRALGEKRLLRDVSEATLERLLGENALRYATRAALASEPSGLAEIAEAYATARGCKAMASERIAEAGRAAVVHALGEACAISELQRSVWTRRLETWWRLLERKGWANPGSGEAAWQAFQVTAVPAIRVATVLLDRCFGAREVTLVGFGQNGRLLAEEAKKRGMRVLVRDDRLADGKLGQDMAGVEVEPMGAPIPVGRAVIVTPLEDAGLLSRFAEYRPQRWRECLHELSRPLATKGPARAA